MLMNTNVDICMGMGDTVVGWGGDGVEWREIWCGWDRNWNKLRDEVA